MGTLSPGEAVSGQSPRDSSGSDLGPGVSRCGSAGEALVHVHAADDDGLLSFPRNHLTQVHCLHKAVVVRSPQSPSLQAQSSCHSAAGDPSICEEWCAEAVRESDGVSASPWPPADLLPREGGVWGGASHGGPHLQRIDASWASLQQNT